jgi:hypothetical protein
VAFFEAQRIGLLFADQRCAGKPFGKAAGNECLDGKVGHRHR